METEGYIDWKQNKNHFIRIDLDLFIIDAYLLNKWESQSVIYAGAITNI